VNAVSADVAPAPDLRPDVVVIGGGVAGALAAARAQALGATVVLVKKPGGGTALSSGAIDVADGLLGLVPGEAHDPLARGEPWRQAMDIVAARLPRHPYARAGTQGRERVGEAVALLQELAATSSDSVELVARTDGNNHVVATQLGTVKRTALVQASQLLDLSTFEGDAIGVVEPQDLAGFSARSSIQMLSFIIGLGGRRVQLLPVLVDRTLPGRQTHGSAAAMARHLDDASRCAAFCGALQTALGQLPRAPSHLLVPAILGADRSALVHADVEKTAGCPVRELLASPPSAPGHRLGRALTSALRQRGVGVVEGAAVSATVHERRASTIVVERTEARVELRPRAMVLTSGRFFSGGVVRDGTAREPLFGLPVVTDAMIIGDRFIGDFVASTPEGDHGIFRAGVAVDDAQRPLDASGRVALENVACAGSLVEGWDPARDGTGAGVAALSGLLAGERAASWVRG
jgi:glycerol-3-phosphate dehydrogenase subunit B